MDVRVGDTLEMTKPHPCGGKTFLVLRTGLDVHLRYTPGDRDIMDPRVQVGKRVKKILREDGNTDA